jgi:DNA invertase Pin-like site-specific DNA recombinase
MQNKTDKIAALYYRAANKQQDSAYLDNQMQKLLCYATEQGLDGFALYADIGKSGLTLDRPAFNALKADIEAGRIGKVVIKDVARVARDFILADKFFEWAQARGVEIISIMDGVLTAPPYADISALYRSFLKGGGRV